MSDSYVDELAGTVAVGYLDCALLEYARGIKYFVDRESRKPNGDTHLINLLRRAACVGWENIHLFKAPIDQPLLHAITEHENLTERVRALEAALQAIINLPPHPMRKKAVTIANAALAAAQETK